MADDTALQVLVTEALYRALTEQKREELIKTALAGLIAPSTIPGSYGSSRGPSQLEQAFALAVHNVAHTVVKEMMATDEMRTRIREIAASAFEKMLTDKDLLATNMAHAMVGAITKAGNY